MQMLAWDWCLATSDLELAPCNCWLATGALRLVTCDLGVGWGAVCRCEQEQEKQDERVWRQKAEELRQYKAAHGHCHVSAKSSLGLWMQTQRTNMRRGRLPPERQVRTQSTRHFPSDHTSIEQHYCMSPVSS